MIEVWRQLSNTAGSELHSVFIQPLMDSTEAAEPSQQYWRAARVEGWKREQQIDGYGTSHLLEVQQSQGSLLNLVEEEHLSGLRDHPANLLLFSETTNGASWVGFREHLSHMGFWHPLFLLKIEKKSSFFPLYCQLAPSASFFLCPSLHLLSLSISSFFCLWIMSLFVIQLACWVRLHK